jgi:hypothetical protein
VFVSSPSLFDFSRIPSMLAQAKELKAARRNNAPIAAQQAQGDAQ